VLAMTIVIAQYLVQSGRSDEVAAILAQHVVAARGEPGCLRFDVNRSVEEPDRFVLYEEYVDDAAFEAHRVTPHFRSLIEGKVVPLLAERTFARYHRVEPVTD
jgi:(4S)-4-hydroxy-5-phosphonooxypentane-2,3-dione isomerase